MSPLTDEERRFLLHWARRSLEAAVCGNARGEENPQPTAVPGRLDAPSGAFVSLHKKGHLRGCIGYVHATRSLCRTVMEAAEAAASRDPRFPPVQAVELPDLDVEISVLSLVRAVRPEEVQVGTHGLLITQDRHQGLLLPQVAFEHQWDRELFLEETCRKAGLAPDAWRRGATIEAFTADVFGEELRPVAQWPVVQRNEVAGATPAPPDRPGKFPPG
jgi:AmmeMemoRadiSam system protein A